MSQMLKSSGAMAAATMFSRILGMVREVVYSGFMGADPVAELTIRRRFVPAGIPKVEWGVCPLHSSGFCTALARCTS